jgi:hypothetical protein
VKYLPQLLLGVRQNMLLPCGQSRPGSINVEIHATSMPLEVLDVALVALGGFARGKSSQVPPLARLRIPFARIKAIVARFKFLDHKIHLVVPDT